MRADLAKANLADANLTHANLEGADLTKANLCRAMLCGADLWLTILNSTDLCNADFAEADLMATVMVNLDFSNVKHLDLARHHAPSFIGTETLFRSKGRLSVDFLRGCGVPEDLITYLPSLLGTGIEFYSSFISYSHKDEEFTQRLHSRMQQEHLRVWYAPEDIAGGKKLHEQIFDAIRVHDKLLLVLSEHSMNSEWVKTEIRRTRKREREEARQLLFPIRLIAWDKIAAWECFDADSGKDLAVEIREYYIPDFCDWKDHDKFEAEFTKLLRDLKQPRQAGEPAAADRK